MSEKLQEWIADVIWAERVAGDLSRNAPAGQVVTEFAERYQRLSELAAYLRDGGWLPIESAPKDGTVVDVWFPSGRLANAFWAGSGWGTRQWKGGRDGFSVTRVRQGEDATHYRPLPAPPAALATPGGEE